MHRRRTKLNPLTIPHLRESPGARQFRYVFLVWNLFLAWLPLVFALLACERFHEKTRQTWRFFGFDPDPGEEPLADAEP